MLAMFHPGDLGLYDWFKILAVFLGVPSVIVMIVGFLLYRVIKRHSARENTTTNITGGS